MHTQHRLDVIIFRRHIFPLLNGKDVVREKTIFFEHEGNAAVRLGQFKLVKKFGYDWEFYDIEADRTELMNLAGRGGQMEDRLKETYEHWAARVGVQPWEELLPKLLQAWGINSAHG